MYVYNLHMFLFKIVSDQIICNDDTYWMSIWWTDFLCYLGSNMVVDLWATWEYAGVFQLIMDGYLMHLTYITFGLLSLSV